MSPAAPPRSDDTLLVFSDDWERHPSSCQHLVAQLLDRYRVVWVNTIGTRRPSLDLYSVKRASGKLWAWSTGTADPPGPPAPGPTPTVVNPLMWPSFRSRAGRRMNRTLLARSVEKALRQATSSQATRCHAITTLPIVADLVEELPVERWLYYCVDDLAAWPGLDGEPLRRMEVELLRKVDNVVCVSESLRARLGELGRSAQLLTHGVDLGHWAPEPDSPQPSSPLPVELTDLPRPWIVFWGVLDARLDTAALGELSRQLETGSILLLGPVNEPAPRIADLRNVHAPGPLAYSQLPAVAREMAVAVMPYADMPATRAMQPLKLKEYLATGKPVVVSRLPAVGEWSDACDVVSTPAEFAERVLERLQTGLPAEHRNARERLHGEDWSSKARELEAALFADDRDSGDRNSGDRDR